jgi:hypothetical protein
VTEAQQPEAAALGSLKGWVNEDGKFAVIRATKPNVPPADEENFDVNIPVELLPRVLGLALHLIENADAKLPSPTGGGSAHRCFDASAVRLGKTGDGRHVLTFELAVGGKISIAVNDGQTRTILEGMSGLAQ